MLLLMSLPLLIWAVVFKYIPLWGWSIAFQDYAPSQKFWQQKWDGFKAFRQLFSDEHFINAFRNTMAMAFIHLVLGFLTAIVFAILLNELRMVLFKRVIQTISYLPHFISFVVAASIVEVVLQADKGGIVNKILMNLGIIHHPILWLGIGKLFWGIFGATDVWKNLGWNTIVYLAALTTINPALYESAEIDGAGRFKRIFYITLPSMKSIIVLLLIMNIGWMLEQGFDLQYLLQNGMNVEYSRVIDTYVLYFGFSMGDYSLTTAAGIFKSVVSIILLIGANYTAKLLGEERLF